LGVDIFDYPPGPTYPPGPSIVARTAAGAPPLVAVSQPPPIGETPPPTGDTPPPIGDLPPPIGDRVAFQVNGTNLRVVGSATLAGSELTFDVFDAAGRLVAHFGGQ
jgi:hypothetical protein